MNKESHRVHLEYIYTNNHFIACTDACVTHNDRGLTLGDGIFETMLSYKSNIAFFDQHWLRLTESAAVLGIKIPSKYSKQSVYSIIKELLKLNYSEQDNSNLDSNNWHGIKIILTRGGGPRSIEPLIDFNYQANIIISSFKATQPSLNSKTLIIPDSRINQTSPLTQIKSLNYLDKILAKQHALDNNYDDTLLVNFDNNICSATTSNIFFILSNNTIITPPLSDGVLPGITRGWVINYLLKHNITILEQSINLNNLYSITAAFLTNSIMGIANIGMIGNKDLKEDLKVSVTHDNLLKAMQNHLVSYHV